MRNSRRELLTRLFNLHNTSFSEPETSPRRTAKESLTAGNIHHPELQNDFEKNSKENAIQKAKNCENFELLMFAVPQEKTDCVKPDSLATRGKRRERKPRKSSSVSTIDQAGSSSAGNIHHPQLQTELKNFE